MRPNSSLFAFGITFGLCTAPVSAAPGDMVARVNDFEILERDLTYGRRALNENDAYDLFSRIQAAARNIYILKKMGHAADRKEALAFRSGQILEHEKRMERLLGRKGIPKANYESLEKHLSKQLEGLKSRSPFFFLEDMVKRFGSKEGRYSPMKEAFSEKDIEIMEEFGQEYFWGTENSVEESISEMRAQGKKFGAFLKMFENPMGAEMSKHLNDVLTKEAFEDADIRLENSQIEPKVREYFVRVIDSKPSRTEVIGPFGPDKILETIANSRAGWAGALFEAAKGGKDYVPVLLTGLESKERKVAPGCLGVLRFLKEKRALPQALRIAREKRQSPESIEQALSLIARLAPKELPALVDEFVTRWEGVKYRTGDLEEYAPREVAQGFLLMRKIWGGKAKRLLAPYLKSDAAGVRLYAALELSHLGDPRAFPIAKFFLERSSHSGTVTKAVKILEKFDSPEAIRVLDSYTKRTGEEVGSLSARKMEVAKLAPKARWHRLGELASGQWGPISNWAFNEVNAGLKENEPLAEKALRAIAKNPKAAWNNEANRVLKYEMMKRERMKGSRKPGAGEQ